MDRTIERQNNSTIDGQIDRQIDRQMDRYRHCNVLHIDGYMDMWLDINR